MRLKILRVAIFALFVIIVLNLGYAQVIRGPYYYNLSVNNRIRVVSIESRRGRILDRNGVVLADSRISFDILVIPQEIEDEESLFRYLGRILKEDPQELHRRFKQDIFTPFAPVPIAEDVRQETAVTIEENKFRFPGLLVQAGSRRWYPHEEASAHVLGYVGKINAARIRNLKEYGYTPRSIVGYSGVEEFYDQYLRGKDGGLQIEVNSRGQQVRLLSLKEPLKGKDITLSIDQRMQKIAADLLRERTGSIVVMDMESGEILTLTSSPSFDPNTFVDEKDRHQAARLFSDKRSPFLNRAIGGQYPPGSVFKVALAFSALALNKIDPGKTFMCPGYYQLGRRQFRCAHVHGAQNLQQAIMHSCNVYFYNLSLVLGPEPISRFAKNFGLGSPTGIDLPYEADGFIPSPAQRRASHNLGWYRGDTLNLSIGQGDVLTTPLQLVQMMARMGSGGKIVYPHLLRSNGEKVLNKYSSSKQMAFGPEAFKLIQEGLKGVVADSTGTAHVLDIDGFSIAGKTGTAQTSGNRLSHAWFVGHGVFGNTKLAFCVFLEYGGSSYHAAVMARNFFLRMKKENIL
jgi:penicillin-binding protein 2